LKGLRKGIISEGALLAQWSFVLELGQIRSWFLPVCRQAEKPRQDLKDEPAPQAALAEI
jgi:hypothetical protein